MINFIIQLSYDQDHNSPSLNKIRSIGPLYNLVHVCSTGIEIHYYYICVPINIYCTYIFLLCNFIAIYFTQFPAKNIFSCVLSVYLCCRLMMIVWHWFLMLLLIWRWEVLILNHPDSHLNGNISSVFLIFRRIF